MAFASWSDFLSMGGHGAYVWSVYGVALLLLMAQWWHIRVERRRRWRRLERQVRRARRQTGVSGNGSDA